MDGEHHAAVVTVVILAVLPFDGEAHLFKKFRIVTVLLGVFGEGLPFFGAVTQMELLDDGVEIAALTEILQSYRLAFVGVPQGIHEELVGEGVDVEHLLALGLGHPFFWRQLFFFDLDVVFSGEIAKRLGIGDMLVFHEELGRVAALAAAEALEDVTGRVHVEGARLLVVERAQSDVVRPAFLQRDEFSHHLLDTGGLQDLIYCFPWDRHCLLFALQNYENFQLSTFNCQL